MHGDLCTYMHRGVSCANCTRHQKAFRHSWLGGGWLAAGDLCQRHSLCKFGHVRQSHRPWLQYYDGSIEYPREPAG